jgi:GR25 family glycosyltransferase involved in LPS biosynthesis
MSLRGFYINLDRSDERRRHMQPELGKLAAIARYERFPAVEGRDVTGWPQAKNRGELGCYLSHLGVIRENAGYDGWLHVMEDDVVVSRFAAKANSQLISKPDFDRFDVVFHSVTIKCDLFAAQQFRRLYDRNVVAAASGNVTEMRRFTALSLGRFAFFGCVSYLVNPRAIGRVAELLARRLEADPFEPVDRVFSMLAGMGELSMACTAPFLVVPRLKNDSIIQEKLDLWRLSQILIKHALYADRNVAEIRRSLSALEENSAASPTSELIADAYKTMINGNLPTLDIRDPDQPA